MIAWDVRARQAAAGLIFLWLLGLSCPVFAQQGDKPPVAPPASSDPPAAPVIQPAQATTTSAPKDDRIFWALPNLLTVEKGSTLPPLSAKVKFKLVAQGTFDPVEFGFIGMVTSVNQAENTNPTFRQGLIGYSKRYGLAFTDNAIGNFGTGAIYPALLHQDPRYYQMGKGAFFHRFFYAGTRVFVTRGDSGQRQFNFSELLGNATAAGISNAYHPGPRTLVSNVTVWWTQIGWDSVSYELKEFWPDIHRVLRHGKHAPM